MMRESDSTPRGSTLWRGKLDALWSIGAEPGDSGEVRLQKRLLVGATVMVGSCAVLWGLLYLLFDEPVAASIPWGYSVASTLSLGLFASERRYSLFRSSQLLLLLILPFLLMVELGGFASSSGVILWALISPLGALVFVGRREALRWFVGYLALVAVAPHVGAGAENHLPAALVTALFAMNIGGTSIVACVLLQAFVGDRDLAIVTLDRKHERVRDAFSSYVSPNLAEYLMDNTGALELGGERRDCSFVLTDIAGFTGLVEHADPSEIFTLLNEYLDGMTRAAFAHGGTLDRVTGDAVAVIFSAPVEQADHAQRAVACALAMDRFAVHFAERQRARGIPLGVTRIGVNSGPVIIGNVGSENHLDYRALGDAINTASRLEGANRFLGTRVCIGQATVDRCPGISVRPVGTLILKGKSTPLVAYEPWPDAEPDEQIKDDFARAYDMVRVGDPTAEAAFKTLFRRRPRDPIVALYADRLRNGLLGSRLVFAEK